MSSLKRATWFFYQHFCQICTLPFLKKCVRCSFNTRPERCLSPYSEVATLLETETGRRTIINAFLHNASKCAVGQCGKKNVAVFTEIGVEHPDIPGIGKAGGNLDLLVAKINENRDLKKHDEQITATQPYLTVIEAKKIIQELSSESQLLAKLI